MAGNDGAASLHCVAIRVAQLAADGSTPPGNLLYVSDALVKIDFNADVENGPEAIVRNASGALCVINKLPDIVKRLTCSIELCTPDPELEAILTGGSTYVSGGNVVGYQYPQLGPDPVPNGVSIEAWTHAWVGDHIAGDFPFMHWVFPKAFNLHKSTRTIDINPMANIFDGYFQPNVNWGNGPANDWLWDSTSVAQWTRTDVHPTPALGAQVIA